MEENSNSSKNSNEKWKRIGIAARIAMRKWKRIVIAVRIAMRNGRE